MSDVCEFSGLEDEMVGYIFGRRKATDVAHSWVFPHPIQSPHVLPFLLFCLDLAACSISFPKALVGRTCALLVESGCILFSLSLSLSVRVWKHVVREGDTVVDATCGNGHDTLALVKLVAGESARGRVYGMDIQEDALQSTSCFLGQSLGTQEVLFSALPLICFSPSHLEET